MRCHFKSSNSDWTRFQVPAFWSSPRLRLGLDQIGRTWSLVLIVGFEILHQGLDYFAADGSRAFDELLALIPKLVEYGATDREWEVKTAENLKTARLYLKGDYKVHVLDKNYYLHSS